MFTGAQIVALRSSFAHLERRAPEVSETFFLHLFAAQPLLRAHLPRTPAERSRELWNWIGTVVRNLDRIDSVSFLLEDAGQRCQRAGLQPLHFGQARDALLSAMHQTVTPGEGQQVWNAEIESLWTEALNIVVSIMIRGAGRARARAA